MKWCRAGEQRAEAHLLVTPPRCPVPDGLRAWGWQVQPYALRSAASWGIGDLGDLRTLVTASGAQGAGLVLLNLVHAVMPTLPLQPSPYYPASRRFVNPLYLRVEDCDGYERLGSDERARVDALAAGARAGNAADRIDRDAAWEAKRAALALLAAQPLSPERAAAFAAYRAGEGAGLADFATACALSERHGRTVASWPGEPHDPWSAAVEAARRGLSPRDGALLPPSRPLSLEELLASSDVAALATVLHAGRTHAPSTTWGPCEDGGRD